MYVGRREWLTATHIATGHQVRYNGIIYILVLDIFKFQLSLRKEVYTEANLYIHRKIPILAATLPILKQSCIP
jgi:hypothetical protein